MKQILSYRCISMQQVMVGLTSREQTRILGHSMSNQSKTAYRNWERIRKSTVFTFKMSFLIREECTMSGMYTALWTCVVTLEESKSSHSLLLESSSFRLANTASSYGQPVSSFSQEPKTRNFSTNQLIMMIPKASTFNNLTA